MIPLVALVTADHKSRVVVVVANAVFDAIWDIASVSLAHGRCQLPEIEKVQIHCLTNQLQSENNVFCYQTGQKFDAK